MSRTHDIDNAEPVFQFDSYEQLKVPFLEDASRVSDNLPSPSGSSPPSSTTRPSLYRSLSAQSSMHQLSSPDVKGKGIAPSEPVPIRHRDDFIEDPLFSLSYQSPSSSTHPPDSMLPFDYFTSTTSDFITSEMVEMIVGEEPLIGKGKGRELPPTLPPLSFLPPSFMYGSPESATLPGPSSYDSTFSSIVEVERSPMTPSSVDTEGPASPPNTPDRAEGEDAPHIPIRARSLSSLSNRSRRSLSGLSINKVKFKLGNTTKAPSTIARRLLFKKTQSPPSSPLGTTTFQLDEPLFDTNFTPYGCVGQAGCLTPWVRDFRSRTPVATPVVETDLAWGAIHSAYRAPRPTDPNPLRTKGRSYSSPLPLQTSVFDIVPLAPADIFAPPVPTPAIIPDYFDEFLPRELKLLVFAVLVCIHEAEHEKRVRDGKWTALKAGSSKNKWVGKDKGIRELFKLSRVSKEWHSLIFDGQLWVKLELRSFPKLPSSVLCRLAELAGGFIREIDFTGRANISASTMIDIGDHLCVKSPHSTELPHTHLTSINLQGCSALTSRSLHHLLIRSPALKALYVKGLLAVTNTTCDVLATYCPKLVTLDMSRCPNMNGEGVRSVAEASVARGDYMMLKVLRLAGLRRVTDAMMRALGKAAPYLEVLDISGARDLHNSSIDAFVSCTAEDATSISAVQLTSREAGRDPTDPTRHWRRVTNLRHLSLSGCILLTDHACSHLAHSVPKLELLELAGIGPELRDDGVIRLLETTPLIRKIDFEDATEITDDVLEVLTPSQPLVIPSPPPEPAEGSLPGSQTTMTTSTSTRVAITPTTPEPTEPGHALEHLIISYSNISSDALSELIQACTRLRILEADNTRMTGLALKDFILHARKHSIPDCKIVAIDCRGVGEHAVKDLTPHTRPRLGWRSYHARKLGYLDGRDDEGLTVGQDECDPSRIVVKTFYSWQTVDAVRAARDKKRKSGSRRGMNASNGSTTSEEAGATSSGRARWWSPSGRRSGGPNTPTLLDMNDREGCTIM